MFLFSGFVAALFITLLPALVSGAIFPADTKVKMLDPKGFRKSMKENRTSVVAFVAPWCGHCQRMAPEYSKAAQRLHPMVPFYAVDCDAEANKRLCADQGVQGFPTVKMFPRGNLAPAVSYDSGERTSNAFFEWVSRTTPNKVKNLHEVGEIVPWAEKLVDSTRVLLLNKDKKMPLLWRVLGNNYWKKLVFGHHSDPRGIAAEALGFTPEESTSKVVIYTSGSMKPTLYEGLTKYDYLSSFFDSVLDGTADLPLSDTESVKQSEEAEQHPKDEL